jgi:hypothetical protein
LNLEFRETDARPPGIAEWEELLIRLEIAPRALRIAVEEAPDTPALRATLRELLAAEVLRIAQIDAMTAGESVPSVSDQPHVDAGATAEHLAIEFNRLRARLFARAQRRGISVWEWEGATEDGSKVSAYQLLVGAMKKDAALLAAARSAARAEAAGC